MNKHERLKIYNRVPRTYSSKGTTLGSNSEIYDDIVSELEERAGDAEEVHLALYLFNNMELYRRLLNCANRGARVIVISIPLAGYDRRKIVEAKQVYAQILQDKKVELRIFPHMYIWYGAEYAGGGASYSFHIKAGLIRYKDKSSKAFLTSANLAPGDPTHSETAVFLEASNASPVIQMFKKFFDEVERRAKPFAEYNKIIQGLQQGLHQVFDFSFVAGINRVDFSREQVSQALFTAPFITIEGNGSNHYARELLVKTILSAKQRLLVCTQHFHDILPFNNYHGNTIVHAITELKKINPHVDARVLKQVGSSGLADKRRAAFVESHLYYAGVPQKVNKLVHDKFVIADDILIVSSGNFTATQFAYGRRQMEYKVDTNNLNEVQKLIDFVEKYFAIPEGYVSARKIRSRKRAPKVKIIKSDIFSEVNGFMVIVDAEAASQVAEYFDRLWNHNLSMDIEVPK
jgi:hypothetical protein